MKIDVRELFGEDTKFWADYQPMLEAFGNIAIQVDDEDYQGDSRVLYAVNGKIGFLEFGWGSCSGCDALQACGTLDEVQELCDDLQVRIKWFDNKQQALKWFKTHDWEGDYSWEQKNTNEFVQKCIDYLSEGREIEKVKKRNSSLLEMVNNERDKVCGYEQLAKVHSAYITILLKELGATEENTITITPDEVTEALKRYEARAVPNGDGSFSLYCEVTSE